MAAANAAELRPSDIERGYHTPFYVVRGSCPVTPPGLFTAGSACYAAPPR
jgi:hypothetical protein